MKWTLLVDFISTLEFCQVEMRSSTKAEIKRDSNLAISHTPQCSSIVKESEIKSLALEN